MGQKSSVRGFARTQLMDRRARTESLMWHFDSCQNVLGPETDGMPCVEITMRVAKRLGAMKSTKVILGGGGHLVDAVGHLVELV